MFKMSTELMGFDARALNPRVTPGTADCRLIDLLLRSKTAHLHHSGVLDPVHLGSLPIDLRLWKELKLGV